MKIGVSAYSFKKYMDHTRCNYIDICNLAKEIGYDGIEFIDLNPEISGRRISMRLTALFRSICRTGSNSLDR